MTKRKAPKVGRTQRVPALVWTKKGMAIHSGFAQCLTLYRNDWLAQQAKEKRRCRIVCMSITLAVLLVVIAAAIVGWYFTKVRKI
jgi:hypothetical protein